MCAVRALQHGRLQSNRNDCRSTLCNLYITTYLLLSSIQYSKFLTICKCLSPVHTFRTPNPPPQGNPFPLKVVKITKTRMHSSRMRTTCSLTMVWKKGKKAKENLKNAKKYKKNAKKKCKKMQKKIGGSPSDPPGADPPGSRPPSPRSRHPSREQTPHCEQNHTRL